MSRVRVLEITGLYHEGEEKPEGYASIGFARADQVKALFAGLIPDSLDTHQELE